jgi:PAS domain S-box-containing protein
MRKSRIQCRSPVTFFPGVVVSAAVGGLGPGLLATLLSAAAADFFVTEPHLHFGIFSDPVERYAAGLFVVTGVALSVLGESLLRSRRRLTAGERRYAVTLASIGDAVIATDAQARVTFLNPAAEVLTGWALADAAGRPLAEVFRIVNEETRAPVESPAEKVLRLGTVVGLANHTALLTRNGREKPIDDCGAPILDENGAVVGVVLVFRDVSGRRRVEEGEAARRASERMELAVRGSQVGVWVIDMPDGDYRRGRRHYLNVWEQLGFDRPPAGWQGGTAEPPPDYSSQFAWTAGSAGPEWEAAAVEVHPDDAARIGEAIRAHLAGETPQYEAEARFQCRDGSYRTMLARGRAVRDATGKPVRFAGTLLDVTPLKRVEQALRESEARFRVFVDHAADAFFLQDEQGRILDVNRRACESLGYSRDELIGMTPFDFDPDITPASIEDLGRRMTGGEAIGFESRHRRKDGTTFPVEVRGKAFWEGGRRFLVSLVRDATERRRAEEALRESEGRFRGTFENAAVGIAHEDLGGRFLRVNERFGAILGFPPEELVGKTLAEVTHPDDLEADLARLAALTRGESSSYVMEKRFVRKDGTPVWAQLTVSLQSDAGGGRSTASRSSRTSPTASGRSESYKRRATNWRKRWRSGPPSCGEVRLTWPSRRG